jgi:hypothetical protein
MKWAMALWVEPQMVVAQHVRPGPCGDVSDLQPLATAANELKPFEPLIASDGRSRRSCRS